MPYSRRDLHRLIPALVLAKLSGAGTILTSKAYPIEDLPEKTIGENKSWQVLDGATHTGCQVDLHITQLGPGEAPHPPHSHAHEEIILMERGTLEVTIGGVARTIGPGSVATFASNEKHGVRNTGTTSARYFVLAMGRDKA